VRDWFENLAPRERLFVSVGAIAAVLMMFWALVLYPLGASTKQRAARIAGKQADLEWMLSAAAELKASGGVTAGVGDPDQSLVVVIDRSARQLGLGQSLTRNQPVGEDGIRVRLESAPFDALARWLGQLQGSYGLALDSASIERGNVEGTVTASLILRQPG
jgi:type II secretory pathway component PulM